MTEWRSVPGLPAYEVSSDGQVRSYKWGPTPRLLLQTPLRSGHLRVHMYDANRTRRSLQVHRIVLMAFIGMPTADKPICRHLDGDPTNNRVENLCWGTYSENNCDRARHGYIEPGRRMTHCKYGHEFTPENTVWRADGTRTCRTCRRRLKQVNDRKYRERKKARGVPDLTPEQRARKVEQQRQRRADARLARMTDCQIMPRVEDDDTDGGNA